MRVPKDKAVSDAKRVFTEVLRDVVALLKFRATHRMQTGAWEAQVPADIRERFVKQEFVVVQPHIVYLTEHGLEILEYTESRVAYN